MPPKKGLRRLYGFEDILQDLRESVNEEVLGMVTFDTFGRFRRIPQGDAAIQAILDGIPSRPSKEIMRNCVIEHFLYSGSIGFDVFSEFCMQEYTPENLLWFAHFKKMEEAHMRPSNDSMEFLNLLIEGYNQFLALGAQHHVNICSTNQEKVEGIMAKVNATLARIRRRQLQEEEKAREAR